MSNLQEQVLLGARIPVSLKEKLNRYCLNHGIKMTYFITEAIKEKLLEVVEDKQDIAAVHERLNAPRFISQKEFDKYLSKRGIGH